MLVNSRVTYLLRYLRILKAQDMIFGVLEKTLSEILIDVMACLPFPCTPSLLHILTHRGSRAEWTLEPDDCDWFIQVSGLTLTSAVHCKDGVSYMCSCNSCKHSECCRLDMAEADGNFEKWRLEDKKFSVIFNYIEWGQMRHDSTRLQNQHSDRRIRYSLSLIENSLKSFILISIVCIGKFSHYPQNITSEREHLQYH